MNTPPMTATAPRLADRGAEADRDRRQRVLAAEQNQRYRVQHRHREQGVEREHDHDPKDRADPHRGTHAAGQRAGERRGVGLEQPRQDLDQHHAAEYQRAHHDDRHQLFMVARACEQAARPGGEQCAQAQRPVAKRAAGRCGAEGRSPRGPCPPALPPAAAAEQHQRASAAPGSAGR
ncbi:MAG: hypothetical protein MZV65_21475 [Chromatiales bacterium]|nr:hypothetical protein [Chromatiales bacterium]